MSEAGSGIEGMRDDSPFARYVASRLRAERFKLVDVGCAGGLAPGWRVFGDQLSALGFDANASEIDRLNAVETNPAVRHVAGWIGMPEDHKVKRRIGSKAFWHRWASGRLSYERTQDLRAARREGREPQSLQSYFRQILAQDWSTEPVGGFDLDYAAAFERFAPNLDETQAALKDHDPVGIIHLPPYLAASNFYDADFLKLDIDGPDYEVLRSLGDFLAQPSLLGVSLEVCFYGSHDANDNSFHNMDRLMREKGFDLFGLSVRTYASAALPWPYLDAHPSMTSGGRPVQGDALYLRDLGSRVLAKVAATLSDHQLAKSAALFALFSLPDHAAEMLLVHRERLAAVLDIDHALDLLAGEMPEMFGKDPVGYSDYIAAFEAEDPSLFGLYDLRNAWHDDLLRIARQAPAKEAEREDLSAQLAQARTAADERQRHAEALESRLVAAQAEAEAARSRADRLQARLEQIEQSSSWRLTAPLRAIATSIRRGR